MRREPKPTPEELAAQLAEGHPKDIFYSTIDGYVKRIHPNNRRKRDDLFFATCRLLEQKGIWVHS